MSTKQTARTGPQPGENGSASATSAAPSGNGSANGNRMSGVPSAFDLRTTRYSDVCGGTDEFKRVLVEEPGLAASPEGHDVLRSLVEDGTYMLARMAERLREYQAFRDELAALAQRMQEIVDPRLNDSTREAEALLALLNQEGRPPVTEAIDRAEEIRQVANDMEGALRRHKEAAIEAGRAYLQLKGSRGWDDGAVRGVATVPATSLGATPAAGQPDSSSPASAAAASAAAASAAAAGQAAHPLPPGVPEAWLPPSPHREQIVDWLRRGRAALLTEAEAARFPVGPQGREPLVQFEDGGVMPLRVVRWSDEVRNFHPLGTTPHPRSRLYRGRSASPAAEPSAS